MGMAMTVKMVVEKGLKMEVATRLKKIQKYFDFHSPVSTKLRCPRTYLNGIYRTKIMTFSLNSSAD